MELEGISAPSVVSASFDPLNTTQANQTQIMDENFSYFAYALVNPPDFDATQLLECVSQGIRNRFTLLRKQDIIDEIVAIKSYASLAQELKQSNTGVDAVGPSPTLIAKFLKAKLEEEEQAHKRRIAEMKEEMEAAAAAAALLAAQMKAEAEEAAKGGAVSKGKKSIAEKGKPDPKASKPDPKAADKNAKGDKKKAAAGADKSAKKKAIKKGKDDEDDEDKAAIIEFDDAPFQGPSAYYLLDGFNLDTRHLAAMLEQGISFGAIVQIKPPAPLSNLSSPSRKKEGSKPGSAAGLSVMDSHPATPKHTLHTQLFSDATFGDISWIEVEDATQKETKTLFTEIAAELYKIVEHKKYYLKWLEKLNLVSLPHLEPHECRTDLYESKLELFSLDLQSIPVILDAMISQVESNLEPKKEQEQLAENSLDEMFSDLTNRIHIQFHSTEQVDPQQDKEESQRNGLIILHEGDQVAKRCYQAMKCKGPVDQLKEIEERMLQFCFVPGKYRIGMPSAPSLTDVERNLEKTQLLAFIPEARNHRVYRQLTLFQFEMMMSEAFPDEQHDFSSHIYEQQLSPNLMSQLFSSTLLEDPEVVTYYHEIDDVLLVGVHLPVPENRINEKEFFYQIPTKVGFSNWRRMNTNSLQSVSLHPPSALGQTSASVPQSAGHDFNQSQTVYTLTTHGNLSNSEKIVHPYDQCRIRVNIKEGGINERRVRTTIVNDDVFVSFHVNVSFDNMPLSFCDSDYPVHRRPYTFASFGDGTIIRAVVEAQGMHMLSTTLPNGMIVSALGDRVIHQKRSLPTDGTKYATIERERKILYSGHVCRYLSDGAIVIYTPDGDVSTYDPKTTMWTVSTIHGMRFIKRADGRIIRFEKIQITRDFDRYSQQETITTEEHTVLIKQRNGGHLLKYRDGTTFIKDVAEETTRIQHNDWCPVDIRHGFKDFVTWLPNRFKIVSTPTQDITIEAPEGDTMSFAKNILSYYVLPLENPSRDSRSQMERTFVEYRLDYNDGSVTFHDLADNTCIIYNDGNVKYGYTDDEEGLNSDDLGSPRSPTPDQMVGGLSFRDVVSNPRLFVVQESGEGVELIQENTLHRFHRSMEQHRDIFVQNENVIGQDSSQCTTYILRNYLSSWRERSHKEYHIASSSLSQRAFKEDESGPTPVLVRRLYKYKPLSEHERNTISSKLQEYNNWKDELSHHEPHVDPRYTSPSEDQLKIKDVLLEALQAFRSGVFEPNPQASRGSTRDSAKGAALQDDSATPLLQITTGRRSIGRESSSNATLSPPSTPDDFYSFSPKNGNVSPLGRSKTGPSRGSSASTTSQHHNRRPSEIGRTYSTKVHRKSIIGQPTQGRRQTKSDLAPLDSSIQDTIIHSGYIGLHLSLEDINFGTVKIGNTYRVTFTMTNMTPQSCFARVQPPSSDDFQCLYAQTSVAPGQATKIDVLFSPTLAGNVKDRLVIGDAPHTSTIPITARIRSLDRKSPHRA
eukprot:TRINITY_DN3584_c0_g1_i4.p1 TRINITY_DN3584_c0_g1~~TRINITY_DN3584_c0_g1_i4.p1  ORF type:complete len:1471 (-),score=295.98 TRINITY_DN3584_c0_g1_i4:4896-9308(-)